jgi:CBS domain-containing protein/ribosome-associated translation inhibitor RaiA
MAFSLNVMREATVVARPEEKISDVLPRMRERKEWVVPVVRGKVLVGLMSYKELLRRRVSDQAKVSSVMLPPVFLLDSDDELRTLSKFFATKARALPVVDAERRVKGIITRESLISFYLKSEVLKDKKVRKFMSSPSVTVQESDSVARARWIMARDNISRLPVLAGERLTGIITTKDIIDNLYSTSGRKRSDIIAEEERIMAAPVRDLMSYPVYTVTGDTSLAKAAEQMIAKGISGMPVLEGERVLGVISTIDVINAIAKEFEITLPIQAKLSRELKEAEKKAMIDGIAERSLAKLERITDILSFKISFKESSKSQAGSSYRVSATASTKLGNFVSTYDDRDPIVAVKGAMERLEKRILKKVKLIEERTRTQSKEES